MSQRELRSKKPRVGASGPTKATASKPATAKSAKRGTASKATPSKHDEQTAKSSSGSPPPKEAPASYRETLQSVKAALQATSPGLKPKELDKMARSVVAAQKKQEQAEKERLDSELLASVCIHAFTLIL